MRYTDAQKRYIDGLIRTQIAPETQSDSLRRALSEVCGRMMDDALNSSDLILISCALEMLTPRRPEDSDREEFREIIEALSATRAMLHEMEQAEA